MAIKTGEDVAVAFGLVIGAAMSTGLGASVVFFPRLVRLASKRVLASSLAFAAGVMIYVSLIEIFQKSKGAFNEGHEPGIASLLTAICFFGGVLIMMALNFLVDWLGGANHNKQAEGLDSALKKGPAANDKKVIVPHCVGCSDDPCGELEEWQANAAKEERDIARGGKGAEIRTVLSGDTSNILDVSDSQPPAAVAVTNLKELEDGNAAVAVSDESIISSVDGDVANPKSYQDKLDDPEEKKRLVQMGLSTALAIALHNFPEGLATFVAALDDPNVGAVLAVALGIHNIPEGLCVALPVYYATGNRWKGFMWGAVSGLTEPIGALIGWVVLANVMSDDVYAILFGLVAGMMTLISMKELIPTAFRYDPEDTVVTHSCVIGMLVMAVSLVLFEL